MKKQSPPGSATIIYLSREPIPDEFEIFSSGGFSFGGLSFDWEDWYSTMTLRPDGRIEFEVEHESFDINYSEFDFVNLLSQMMLTQPEKYALDEVYYECGTGDAEYFLDVISFTVYGKDWKHSFSEEMLDNLNNSAYESYTKLHMQKREKE